MAPDSSPELRPLLEGSSRSSLDANTEICDIKAVPEAAPSREIEDDVLPESSILGRTITWSSAYILVISRVIGSGIFAIPGAIVQSVGSPGLSLFLWVVGAGMAACGLAVSLEYGCMLPRSGGNKVYLEFTYRWPRLLASTLIGIQVILLGFTAGNCIIFSQYALFSLGIDDASETLRKGIAIALLSVVTLIHGVFPKAGIKIQDGLGWIKIAVVIFMILSGVYVLLFRPTSDTIGPSGQLSWDNLWEDSNWNWGIISTSLFKVFYSYAGLENANNVLNEVKDPVRTLRSVSLAALITTCGMYFLVNVAYFLVIPLEEIKESGELIAALFFERLFGEMVGRTVLPLAVGISAAGNVMVVAFAMVSLLTRMTSEWFSIDEIQARIKQEIARQGLLPFADLLSSTKPFNSPLGGFMLNYIPSFLVIVLPPSAGVYSFILEVEGYSGQIFSLAVACGLIYLRFKRPDLQRPFQAWLSAVWVKITLGVALLAAPFFPPAERSTKGLFYATYAIVAVSM
ncbi:Fc.00g079370.m01.CDS01 [Cosmosporella sp. VM-42]